MFNTKWMSFRREEKATPQLTLVSLPTINRWLWLNMPVTQRSKLLSIRHYEDLIYLDFGDYVGVVHYDPGNILKPMAFIGYDQRFIPPEAVPLPYRLASSLHLLNLPNALSILPYEDGPQI